MIRTGRKGAVVSALKQLRQNVSTWSTPLATAFNSPPYKKINFTRDESGLFCLPELRSFEGFYLMRDNVANKTDELITEAISTNRRRKMVEIFDELSDSLCKVADLAEFIRIAHPKIKYSQAAEEACITISGIVENLNTHKPLYMALRDVVENGDFIPTSDVDKHVSKLFLFDFEQSGIHLPENERQKVVRLNDYILQLGQKFMTGAVQPTIVRRSDVPSSVRSYFPSEGDNVLVSGLYTNSSNNQARETAYRLFLQPSQQQDQLLSDLLLCRHELARTCGFETYAHRALNGSTVEHPQMVKEFLDELSHGLRPRADADFRIMEQMKRQDSGIADARLASWDPPYFTSQMERKSLNANTSEFLPYFSLGGCMEGLEYIMRSLYGISLKNTEMEPGEAWNNDIYKISVVHESEGLLGYIYCDFFERNGKPNQDCHFTIQGGKMLPDGKYQVPIVVVMLNLSQPHWTGPVLLSPSRVDNLFHEMGHAMHSMLARTEYQHVTGTRCSTDFAEVPSVLMEYFASDPRVLRTFARHFQTQEPISEDMLLRLCASKKLFSASETQIQVFYSALDHVYHSGPIQKNKSTTDTLIKVQSQYYSLPYVENTAWQLRFSHLVGYGAKYYAYLISKTIASWIWQTYFEENPFNRESGEKYRREILAHGGGVPSRQLVTNFLKRDMTPQILAQSLLNEIDMNNERVQDISNSVLDSRL
ncbi:PREDICTED: mitochondrial intermediate peptidase [Rhagoletis zephyria]|uniref:mitochondrial intermediate peptidase n=1 Tax=Rhagoletis zephyria TaxID=28612 RepID=UPI000811528E|nr:PREDICTED: mitochondrial intermediate peptidase [Rhagoletis zephyria]XP_017463750.1 PREDICTED: mitochondrial intermediate peptidase [Rhagoletis zephyria]